MGRAMYHNPVSSQPLVIPILPPDFQQSPLKNIKSFPQENLQIKNLEIMEKLIKSMDNLSTKLKTQESLENYQNFSQPSNDPEMEILLNVMENLETLKNQEEMMTFSQSLERKGK